MAFSAFAETHRDGMAHVLLSRNPFQICCHVVPRVPVAMVDLGLFNGGYAKERQGYEAMDQSGRLDISRAESDEQVTLRAVRLGPQNPSRSRSGAEGNTPDTAKVADLVVRIEPNHCPPFLAGGIRYIGRDRSISAIPSPVTYAIALGLRNVGAAVGAAEGPFTFERSTSVRRAILTEPGVVGLTHAPPARVCKNPIASFDQAMRVVVSEEAFTRGARVACSTPTRVMSPAPASPIARFLETAIDRAFHLVMVPQKWHGAHVG